MRGTSPLKPTVGQAPVASSEDEEASVGLTNSSGSGRLSRTAPRRGLPNTVTEKRSREGTGSRLLRAGGHDGDDGVTDMDSSAPATRPRSEGSLIYHTVLETPPTGLRAAARKSRGSFGAPYVSQTPDGQLLSQVGRTVAVDSAIAGRSSDELRQPLFPVTTHKPLQSRQPPHDAAVRAILEENPLTAARPVELRPGYLAPSPTTPLWPSADLEEGEDFQSVETCDDGALLSADEAALARSQLHKSQPLSTMSEETDGSFVFNIAGRSLNLLDDEARRAPLQVLSKSRDPEEDVFSLTEEAAAHGTTISRGLPRRTNCDSQTMPPPNAQQRAEDWATRTRKFFAAIDERSLLATKSTKQARTPSSRAARRYAASERPATPGIPSPSVCSGKVPLSRFELMVARAKRGAGLCE